MKYKRVIKYPALIAALFVIFSFQSASYSDQAANQSLKKDIEYYHRVSREKSLNKNDRKFILLRIEEKYAGSPVDLAPLNKEFEKLDGTPQPRQASGSVDKILVSETPSDSIITVQTTGAERANHFVLKDADPAVPVKIVLDIYGAREKLISKARDIRLKRGAFSRVQAAQFEESPDFIVRVVAELRKDKPYKVTDKNGSWVISVKKDEPAQKSAPAKNLILPKSQAKTPEARTPLQISASTGTPTQPSAQPSVKSDISSSYIIEAGDVLAISVYPAEELSREVIVQPDGMISFPLIGSARAKSLTPEQLARSMSEELGKYLSNPQVNITVKQFARRQIFITGEVKSAGAYNYKENLRLMEFISSVGGFTDNADRRAVKIYRGPPTKRQTHTINVEEIISTGDFTRDFLLEPADIIEVSKGKNRISVLGEARTPGYYDFKDNMKLLELISQAGGFTESALISQIKIIRPDKLNAQKVIKVNLVRTLEGKQKDIVVEQGDTVYIPKKSLASANTFLNNILPWLSLISLIIVIRAGI